jgi:hypothetical protein
MATLQQAQSVEQCCMQAIKQLPLLQSNCVSPVATSDLLSRLQTSAQATTGLSLPAILPRNGPDDLFMSLLASSKFDLKLTAQKTTCLQTLHNEQTVRCSPLPFYMRFQN